MSSDANKKYVERRAASIKAKAKWKDSTLPVEWEDALFKAEQCFLYMKRLKWFEGFEWLAYYAADVAYFHLWMNQLYENYNPQDEDIPSMPDLELAREHLGGLKNLLLKCQHGTEDREFIYSAEGHKVYFSLPTILPKVPPDFFEAVTVHTYRLIWSIPEHRDFYGRPDKTFETDKELQIMIDEATRQRSDECVQLCGERWGQRLTEVEEVLDIRSLRHVLPEKIVGSHHPKCFIYRST